MVFFPECIIFGYYAHTIADRTPTGCLDNQIFDSPLIWVNNVMQLLLLLFLSPTRWRHL